MILILAPPNDSHALAVTRAVHELGSAAEIFDSSQFPEHAAIRLEPDRWVLQSADGRRFCSDDVSAIWFRRSRPHGLSEGIVDPSARKFAARECAHAFDAVLFWEEYLVVNPVDKEAIANKKPIQLKAASEIGFEVPRTIVTNSAADLLSFNRSLAKPIVFKVLTSPLSSFGETRRLRPEHIENLSSLGLAPVIFQEELDKEADIRVTVVGDAIFPALVEVRNPVGKAYPDWRLDVTAKCHAIELPRSLTEKIRALVRRLGLYYAAIDLIKTVDGRYYFLEVNPTGQFLFVEIDTGQEISAAFARLLLDGRGAARRAPLAEARTSVRAAV